MKTWRPPKDVKAAAGAAVSSALRARLGITLPKREPLPADAWEFCKRCVWTYDERAAVERGEDPVKRFPALAFLEAVARVWVGVKLLRVKKSRQLLVTWLFAALYLHKALVRRGTRVAWFCLKWDKAYDHIKNRAYRIYQAIPGQFEKPLAAMTDEGLVVYHDGPKTLATAWILPMAAETAKQADAATQMRSVTYTDAYFDEAEFYPNQSELIHSTLPNAENVALVSSANGDTYVNRLGCSTRIEDPTAPLETPKKDRVMRGVEQWDRTGWRHVEVHYSADPAKDPETEAGKVWYAENYGRFPDKLKWRREMELDSTVAAGVPVYADRDRIVQAAQAFRPGLTVFCGRDFGFANPYAVFFQVEEIRGKEQEEQRYLVRVLLEVRLCNLTVEAFERNYVAPAREKYFPGAKVVEYGDPAGEQRKDTSALSAIGVLAAMGRTVFHRSTKVDARIDKLQSIISLGWLHVDPKMAPVLLADLGGGYYRNAHGEPVKDGVHDHGPDAFGYAIDCLFAFDNPAGHGAPVFHPGGLKDVRTGLASGGNVWRPGALDERRNR